LQGGGVWRHLASPGETWNVGGRGLFCRLAPTAFGATIAASPIWAVWSRMGRPEAALTGDS